MDLDMGGQGGGAALSAVTRLVAAGATAGVTTLARQLAGSSFTLDAGAGSITTGGVVSLNAALAAGASTVLTVRETNGTLIEIYPLTLTAIAALPTGAYLYGMNVAAQSYDNQHVLYCNLANTQEVFDLSNNARMSVSAFSNGGNTLTITGPGARWPIASRSLGGQTLRIRMQGTAPITALAGGDGVPLVDLGTIGGYRTYEYTPTMNHGAYSSVTLGPGTVTFFDVRKQATPLSQKFDTDFITACAGANHLRFMDFQFTNRTINDAYTATQRTKPNVMYDIYGQGASVEDCVDMCALAGTGAYLCMPTQCDQSYVNAALDYAHANIASGKQIIVEFVNECNNTFFPIFYYLKDKWIADGNANLGDGYNAISQQVKMHNQVMTWVEAWAAAHSVSVGKTGRIRRVFGNISGSYAYARTTPAAAALHTHTDTVVSALYFGIGADATPTPTTDPSVLLDRWLVGATDVDTSINDFLTVKNLAVADGHDAFVYESNCHTIAPDAPTVTAMQTALASAQAKVVMSYLLREGVRRGVGMLTFYYDFGPITNYPWGLRTFPTGTSPRWQAIVDAGAGVFTVPDVKIVNDPPPAQAGTNYQYTFDVRFGAGFGEPRILSYVADGPQLGLTPNLTNGTLGGTPTGSGTVLGTLSATDASGTVHDKPISIPVAAAVSYAFSDDARTQGTTSQLLTARGWSYETTPGAFYAQNGAMRNNGFQSEMALLFGPQGSGFNRKLLAVLPAPNTWTNGRSTELYVAGWGGQPNLVIKLTYNSGVLGIQILRSDGLYANVTHSIDVSAPLTLEAELAFVGTNYSTGTANLTLKAASTTFYEQAMYGAGGSLLYVDWLSNTAMGMRHSNYTPNEPLVLRFAANAA